MAQPKTLKNDFLKKKGSFWMLCWGQTTQWVWVEAGRPGWRQLSRWEMTLAKTTVVVPWIYSRKRQQDFFQWIRFEYVRERLTSQVVLVAKNLPTNAGDTRDADSIPGSGRSPGGGHGSPLQCSCLENPTDRGACWIAQGTSTQGSVVT